MGDDLFAQASGIAEMAASIAQIADRLQGDLAMVDVDEAMHVAELKRGSRRWGTSG